MDADNIQCVPKGHPLVVRPVGRVGQWCVGVLADGRNNVAPFFFVLQGEIQLGPHDKAVGFAADGGHLCDPLLVSPPKPLPFFTVFERDFASPRKRRMPIGDMWFDADAQP